MDVSEVRARPDGKGVAQTSWSGCAPLEANLTLADGHKLIDLLPNRRSDNQYLWVRFSKAAARFQRNLRQDDFGPTRADQIAALNLNLEGIHRIRESLINLLSFQADFLCSRLDDELRPLVNISWNQIFDAMHDTSSGPFSFKEGISLKRGMPGWRRSADRTRLHANSLLTGNFTGNFAILRLRQPIS
jgi:hypothetical protein